MIDVINTAKPGLMEPLVPRGCWCITVSLIAVIGWCEGSGEEGRTCCERNQEYSLVPGRCFLFDVISFHLYLVVLLLAV